MRNIFFQHFILSFLCMLVTAIICAYLQNILSIDRVGLLVFIILTLIGLIFSIVFAIFQKYLKQTIKLTLIWACILSMYLVITQYFMLTVEIDWNAVSEGGIQLSFFQKILHSEWSFWLAFLFPFAASWIYKNIKMNLIN